MDAIQMLSFNNDFVDPLCLGEMSQWIALFSEHRAWIEILQGIF